MGDQNISFSGNTIGQVNNNSVVTNNNDVIGEKNEGVTNLLYQMQNEVKDDELLDEQCKQSTLKKIDELATELRQPKPKAEMVMGILGHLSNIGTLASYAYKLGHLLASVGFHVPGGL